MRGDVVEQALPPPFFRVVGEDALPAGEGDAAALVFVGEVVAGRVHALVHRVEADDFLAEFENLAEVGAAVTNLHHAERREHHHPRVHGAGGVVEVPANAGAAVEAEEFSVADEAAGPAFAAQDGLGKFRVEAFEALRAVAHAVDALATHDEVHVAGGGAEAFLGNCAVNDGRGDAVREPGGVAHAPARVVADAGDVGDAAEVERGGDGLGEDGGIFRVIRAEEDVVGAELADELGVQHGATGGDEHIHATQFVGKFAVAAHEVGAAGAPFLVELGKGPPAADTGDAVGFDTVAEAAEAGGEVGFLGDAPGGVGGIDEGVAERSERRGWGMGDREWGGDFDAYGGCWALSLTPALSRWEREGRRPRWAEVGCDWSADAYVRSGAGGAGGDGLVRLLTSAATLGDLPDAHPTVFEVDDFGVEAVGLEEGFHAAHDGVYPAKLVAQLGMKVVPDDVAAGTHARGDEEAVLEHGFGVVRGVHEDHCEVAQLGGDLPVAGVGVNLVDAGRALLAVERTDLLLREHVRDELAAAGLVLLGENVDGVDGAAAGEIGGELERAVAVGGAEVETVAGEIGSEGGEDFGVATAAGVEVALGGHLVNVGLGDGAGGGEAEVALEVGEGSEGANPHGRRGTLGVLGAGLELALLRDKKVAPPARRSHPNPVTKNYCSSRSTLCGSWLACASIAVPDCARMLKRA